MGKTSISYFKLLAVALLLMCGTAVAYAEKTVADLDGKDWERYEMFRHLFLNGTPEEFYSYANEYAAELHKKGYMMLYYKRASLRSGITRSIGPSSLQKPWTMRSGKTKPATTTIWPQDSTATSTAAVTTRPVGRHTSSRP